jgi:hypothetical protein
MTKYHDAKRSSIRKDGRSRTSFPGAKKAGKTALVLMALLLAYLSVVAWWALAIFIR